MSRLRRPFLADRYFFITVRRLKERAKLAEADFRLLALAFNRARGMHPFYFTAWVFLPDHRHVICAPVCPVTISLLMKSLKASSMILINRRRAESGELWQARFFDRALRTLKEYNEELEYIHLNPVNAGLVRRPQDCPWSSVNEYSGTSPDEQRRRCGLTIDRVRMPSDPRNANLANVREDTSRGTRLRGQSRGPQKRRSALPAEALQLRGGTPCTLPIPAWALR